MHSKESSKKLTSGKTEKKIEPVEWKKPPFFFSHFFLHFFRDFFFELKKKLKAIFAAGKLKQFNHNNNNDDKNERNEERDEGKPHQEPQGEFNRRSSSGD
jgi:hypothetical protein